MTKNCYTHTIKFNYRNIYYFQSNNSSSDQQIVAQLAAGDLEVTGSNPTTRWETFGLNPQIR